MTMVLIEKSDIKQEAVCEYCGGEGWSTSEGCDHNGEHYQQEMRCECNPVAEQEWDEDEYFGLE